MFVKATRVMRYLYPEYKNYTKKACPVNGQAFFVIKIKD